MAILLEYYGENLLFIKEITKDLAGRVFNWSEAIFSYSFSSSVVQSIYD